VRSNSNSITIFVPHRLADVQNRYIAQLLSISNVFSSGDNLFQFTELLVISDAILDNRQLAARAGSLILVGGIAVEIACNCGAART